MVQSQTHQRPAVSRSRSTNMMRRRATMRFPKSTSTGAITTVRPAARNRCNLERTTARRSESGPRNARPTSHGNHGKVLLATSAAWSTATHFTPGPGTRRKRWPKAARLCHPTTPEKRFRKCMAEDACEQREPRRVALELYGRQPLADRAEVIEGRRPSKHF